MNALTLLAETGGGGQIEQIARTFGVDWSHLIAQMISFSIVCFLLHRFAYRPVLAMLEGRRRTIAAGLANADSIKTELARTETLRREVLAQAETQALKLIEEARAAAAVVQRQEIQKAMTAAELIVSQAKTATEREHARMLSELRHEVGRLIVQTTTVVTGKVLTAEDQKRLAEETTRQFAV